MQNVLHSCWTHQLPSLRKVSCVHAALCVISDSILVAENFAGADGWDGRRPTAQQSTKARHRALT